MARFVLATIFIKQLPDGPQAVFGGRGLSARQFAALADVAGRIVSHSTPATGAPSPRSDTMKKAEPLTPDQARAFFANARRLASRDVAGIVNLAIWLCDNEPDAAPTFDAALALADNVLTGVELERIRGAAYALQRQVLGLIDRLQAMAEPEGQGNA